MRRLAAAAALWLLGCGADDSAAALTRAALLRPETCKDCHPKHYREWSASMHAYALADPVFAAMNRRGQEETGGELGDFCVDCHAPMAVREGAFADGDFSNLDQVPDELRGVTCYFCHNVVDVGPDHFNNGLSLADDTTMRGSIIDPLPPSAHQAEYSKLFDRNRIESSTLCGSCHDIVTPNGVHLERTFAEYEQSLFAKAAPGRGQDTCNGCHMRGSRGAAANYEGVRGDRNVHEHLWAGVDVPLSPFPYREAATAAVEECALPSSSIQFFDVQVVSAIPGAFSFEVTLETGAGHNQPSGATQDRRMWLELQAYDADGTMIYDSGTIADDEPSRRPPEDMWQMHETMLDGDGNEVHMFWEAVTTNSSLTPPLPLGVSTVRGSHGLSRSYEVRQVPARVEVRLRIRPVGFEVLQNLVDSGHLDPTVMAEMPTFTVFTGEADWKDGSEGNGQRFEVRNTTPFDCDRYLCLLDPDAAECER